jgi:hypothetical protein
MLISELQEKLEQGESFDNIVEIKNYLPFVHKQIMINNILKACLQTDENSIMTCDNFAKKMAKDMQYVVNFTNLEFSDDFMEEYEYLVSNKLIKNITAYIDSDELIFIDNILDKEIEQRININNSLSNIIAINLNKVIDKIPTTKDLQKLIKTTKKELNTFDWNKIPELQKIFHEVQGGLNGK